jgi:hypothetical protein
MSGTRKPSASKSDFDVWIANGTLQVDHHSIENIEPGGYFGVPAEVRDFIAAMEAAGVSCDVSQSSLCG